MEIRRAKRLASTSLTAGVGSVFVVLMSALLLDDYHLILLGMYILIASPAASLLFIIASTLRRPGVWLYGAASLFMTALGIVLALN